MLEIKSYECYTFFFSSGRVYFKFRLILQSFVISRLCGVMGNLTKSGNSIIFGRVGNRVWVILRIYYYVPTTVRQKKLPIKKLVENVIRILIT